MLIKEKVRNIFAELLPLRKLEAMESILVKSYYDDNHADEIQVYTKCYSYLFYCNCNDLTIKNNVTFYEKDAGFDKWRKIFENFNTCKKVAKKLSCSESFFNIVIFPILQGMFDLIENQDKYFFEDTILFPIENNNISISYLKQQDWYKKLLQEYTEYTQSGSKSDIVDRHYQEQARLHGLKFVIK